MNMYIQKPEFGVEDFLKAIGFIAPEGYDIQYFIAPAKEGFNVPQGSGFQKMEGLPEDESIVYKRTPPVLKKDYASDPVEYSTWEVPEIKRKLPTPSILPRVTDPGEGDLGSPFMKVQESIEDGVLEFRLTESVPPFPSGTLFKAKRKRI